MLEIQGGLELIEFDEIRLTKTLDRILGVIIREAAREWLRAVLKSVPARGGFPVLTGAAKSTLAPLGRFLRVAVPVRPVAREGRSKIIDRRGEGEGSQTFHIVDDRNNSGSFSYQFEWSTDLLHYYINEFFGFIPHAPWHTAEAGEKAFTEYVERAINTRLPKFTDYIDFVRPVANG